jgi:hypothetical protein
MPDKSLHTRTRHANARSVRGLAAISVLAVVMIGAPVAALHAAGGNVAVKDIRITGDPKLFFERPGADPGGDIAWVVFQTRPRLRVVRQVVVEARGRRGRSFTAGRPNCVRSAILQGAVGLRHGAKYRVRFYGRPGRFGKADTVLTTRTLVARGLGSPGKRPSPPNCRS